MMTATFAFLFATLVPGLVSMLYHLLSIVSFVMFVSRFSPLLPTKAHSATSRRNFSSPQQQSPCCPWCLSPLRLTHTEEQQSTTVRERVVLHNLFSCNHQALVQSLASMHGNRMSKVPSIKQSKILVALEFSALPKIENCVVLRYIRRKITRQTNCFFFAKRAQALSICREKTEDFSDFSDI